MSTEWKWFQSTVTGQIAKYPARFESRPTFVAVEDNADCIDCTHVEDEPETNADVLEPAQPVVVTPADVWPVYMHPADEYDEDSESKDN